MVRAFSLLLLLLAPLAAYVGWLVVFVQRAVARGEYLNTVLMLLGGLAVLAVLEGCIFKLLVLPRLAGYISERLYAGNYVPEDDPLALLARRISAENRPDLIPDLERLVEADPRRVRAWLELAHVLESLLHDTPRAVQRLLQGAECAPNREDAALLIWRAATLFEKHAELAPQALPLFRRLSSEFALTSYGKLAASRLK